MGINKMGLLIILKYYGVSKENILDYIRNCSTCQNFNLLKTIEPDHINDISKKYDRYMIDLSGFLLGLT